METVLPRPTRNGILLKNPMGEKPTIHLEAEALAVWEMEQLEKTVRMEILAKGPACTEVEVGDLVRIKGHRMLAGDGVVIGDDKYLVYTEGDVLVIY